MGKALNWLRACRRGRLDPLPRFSGASKSNGFTEAGVRQSFVEQWTRFTMESLQSPNHLPTVHKTLADPGDALARTFQRRSVRSASQNADGEIAAFSLRFAKKTMKSMLIFRG